MNLKSFWHWIGVETLRLDDMIGIFAEKQKIKTLICHIENGVIKGIIYKLKR